MATPQQFPQKRVMTPVFLSYATPSNARQDEFLNYVVAFLQEEHDLLPYTIGANIDERREPLEQIGGYMSEVNGAITLAFRRGRIASGQMRVLGEDGVKRQQSIKGFYFSSPYCQIETAMAYLNGLPILVAREKGVVADGMLQNGLTSVHATEFDLTTNEPVQTAFKRSELPQIVNEWSKRVRQVRNARGRIERRYS